MLKPSLVALSLLSCAACSPQTRLVVQPEVVSDLPPASLLADCPKPATAAETVGDLVNGILARDAVIDRCNADKAGLRAWRDLRTKPPA